MHEIMAALLAMAASPATGSIGVGPYIVFAISGLLTLVWAGTQIYKNFKDRGDKNG